MKDSFTTLMCPVKGLPFSPAGTQRPLPICHSRTLTNRQKLTPDCRQTFVTSAQRMVLKKACLLVLRSATDTQGKDMHRNSEKFYRIR